MPTVETSAPALVQPGSFLTLHYRMAGPDGVNIINTFEGKPATLSLGTGDAKLAGAPFGAQDPYGIGLPKGSDGAAFVNAFLKKIQADGTWAKLWTVSIGQRTGSTAVPTPPAIP